MLEDFSWLYLFILAFASFRLTHLWVYDEITEPIRRLFIEAVVTEENNEQTISYHPRGRGVRRFIGMLLLCHWCTGVWSAIVLTLLLMLVPGAIWLLIILATAGIAALIESIILRL